MGMHKQGDHVKVELADENSGESEWVWVKVDHSDDEGKLVFGTLDSQPILDTDVKLGQQLAISYEKIKDRRRFAAF
jgi:uncharacterized protein YegJ (DUF2314 family)